MSEENDAAGAMNEAEDTLGKYILDAAGNPVAEPDLFRWAQWYEEQWSSRMIARTLLPGVLVSTVFLALDHDFAGRLFEPEATHRPELWETCVFGGRMNGEMDRYRSRAEALAGHAAMVERVRATQSWLERLMTPFTGLCLWLRRWC